MTIKELRTESGMTQKEFSDFLEIPKRTIENWEGEKNNCPDYTLSLIEDKLINEGLVSDPTLNDGLDRSTIKAIEGRYDGRRAVALKRYASRYGTTFNECNLPACYLGENIRGAIDDLMKGLDWLDGSEDDEEIENQKEFFRSRTDTENGCVIINYVDM